MPEGAQVHLVARRHAELFAGRTVRVASPDGRSEEIVDVFDDRELRGVRALGKHLLYDFGPDRLLHVHLGRFGKFRTGSPPAPEPTPNLRFRMSTEDAWLELRGATAIEIYGADDLERLRARIGPDPLNGDDPTPGFETIMRRRAPLGQLLMDQSILAGIGNIYRAEALFRANVSPMRQGDATDLTTLRGLWSDVRELMEYSLAHDGRIVTTRPAHRAHPRKNPVPRPESFYVYGRAGLPCRLCGTIVAQRAMGGRTLFFCPKCQAT